MAINLQELVTVIGDEAAVLQRIEEAVTKIGGTKEGEALLARSKSLHGKKLTVAADLESASKLGIPNGGYHPATHTVYINPTAYKGNLDIVLSDGSVAKSELERDLAKHIAHSSQKGFAKANKKLLAAQEALEAKLSELEPAMQQDLQQALGTPETHIQAAIDECAKTHHAALKAAIDSGDHKAVHDLILPHVQVRFEPAITSTLDRAASQIIHPDMVAFDPFRNGAAESANKVMAELGVPHAEASHSTEKFVRDMMHGMKPELDIISAEAGREGTRKLLDGTFKLPAAPVTVPPAPVQNRINPFSGASAMESKAGTVEKIIAEKEAKVPEEVKEGMLGKWTTKFNNLSTPEKFAVAGGGAAGAALLYKATQKDSDEGITR